MGLKSAFRSKVLKFFLVKILLLKQLSPDGLYHRLEQEAPWAGWVCQVFTNGLRAAAPPISPAIRPSECAPARRSGHTAPGDR